MYRIWFCFLVFLSGCAPVLSQAVIDQSDPTVTFPDIVRTPESFIGKTVILGGTIIAVKNSQTGSELEVLQRPLSNYRKVPQLNDKTFGRFLIKHNELLDDTIFAKGRKITIAAEVIGSITRSIDEVTYTYPLLRMSEYYLWPKPGNEGFYPNVLIGIGIRTAF